MDTLDKERVRVWQDGAGLLPSPHATQNGTQFKTYELFISGIFHVILSDCSGPR